MSPPSIDDMLLECVEQLWAEYDIRGVGYLDRQQSKLFVEDALFGKKQSSLELDDSDIEDDPGHFKHLMTTEEDSKDMLTLAEFDSIFS